MIRKALVIVAAIVLTSSAQPSPRVNALMEAVRPALPYPAADAEGELPSSGGADAKWFVVWPSAPDDSRIHVKANPLHPETQAAGAEAMARIQAAVVEAERKAQAAYDRAIEELRRTGKRTNVDSVTLEDEGVAGQRIDAELELIIELGTVSSYEFESSVAPRVTAGANGVTWVVTTTANTYRAGSGSSAREHFRPAETRILFGRVDAPSVRQLANADRFQVTTTADSSAFAVVLRGNEQLLDRVVAGADWTQLARTKR